MASKIDQDHNRFRKIVRGKVRRELKNFMSKGELFGRKGRDIISIPLPRIDIPRFRLAPRQQAGVGQGEGDVGQVLGPGQGQDGSGKAGDAPGHHILEVDLTIAELAELLGEELELPRIEPRGKRNIETRKIRYTGISQTGPNSLRHFKRTYKQALKRQIASGDYSLARPIVIPIREDTRYRAFKQVTTPQTNAVIIYMMDVSGSMGDEQKEIVRIESFWIDTWLQSQYKGLETRFIIHDAEAREVDRDTFYSTRESGGTVISSAYNVAQKLMDEHYPPADWNIYMFHFSDGDNWSQGDTQECVNLLRDRILPAVNLFGYGQVESPYGTGQFLHDLEAAFKTEESLVLSNIEGRDAIYKSIKMFLGKGR
ncbi:MAG: DUF444 family protein [Acidobacteria bacterium]|nr:DUF444 family protein [Acidobacteriota bacterium]